MSSEVSSANGKTGSLYYTIMKLACGFGDADEGCFFIVDNEPDTLKLILNYPKVKVCNEIYTLKKQSVLKETISSKKPVLIGKNSTDDDKIREYKAKGSYIILPIIVKNEVFAVITIYNKKDKAEFNNDDFALLNAFSSAASITIENELLSIDLISKNRLEEEMKIAQKIQTAILPKIFDSNNFDISGVMVPAEEVGGDYFDFIVDDAGREWFCVGDVTSHGVTPGLIMMMSQSIINTVVNMPGINPKEAVSRLNKILFENIKNRLGVSEFMTFSIFCHTGNGNFITAGKHIDYLIYRQDTKDVNRVKTNGMWIGVMKDISAKTTEDTFTLNKGDILFLYTDGVTEAPDKDRALFGIDRLINVIKSNGDKKSKDLIEDVMSEINRYLGEQDDDITMLCIKYK